MRPQNKSTESRENESDQVVIGLTFASDWLIEWREFFRPNMA